MWFYATMILIITSAVIFKVVSLSHQLKKEKKEKESGNRPTSPDTLWWLVAIGGSVALMTAGAWSVLANVFTSVWLWPISVTALAVAVIIFIDPPQNKKMVVKKWVKVIAVFSIIVCLLSVLSGGSLDKAERWLLEREQVKIARKVAEAKAKEEASWKGSETIVAPVTYDWSKAVEVKFPSYFRTWQTTVLEPHISGKWEMQYREKPSSEMKTYIGGGPGDEKKTGPKLPGNSPIRFRSLETVPLKIKIQWR